MLPILEELAILATEAGADAGAAWLASQRIDQPNADAFSLAAHVSGYRRKPATEADWLWGVADSLLGWPYPECPAHILHWPVHMARDRAIELLRKPAHLHTEHNVELFPDPSFWVDVGRPWRPKAPPSESEVASARASRVDLSTPRGAKWLGENRAQEWFEDACSLATSLPFGLWYAFQPDPDSWTGSDEGRSYQSGRRVPGGRNYPPHYTLERILERGAAGLLIPATALEDLERAVMERGAQATVMGPLESEPARIISTAHQGFGTMYTVLARAADGYWIIATSLH